MNDNIQTVIIAPMTTVERSYPTRVACKFEGKEGQVVLDQIWTVDKSRLVKRLGTLDDSVRAEVLNILQEMFAP